MSTLRATYDGTQHCTVLQETKGRTVAADACLAGGGKGEELSPAELVGSGLASCMLFTMGMAALQKGLNILGTAVEVDISMTDGPVARIGAINLTFNMPRAFSAADRVKLERATTVCPIKPSFHPDIAIHTHFKYPEPSKQTECCVATTA